MHYCKLNPLQFTGIGIDKKLESIQCRYFEKLTNIAFLHLCYLLLSASMSENMTYACVECFQENKTFTTIKQNDKPPPHLSLISSEKNDR